MLNFNLSPGSAEILLLLLKNRACMSQLSIFFTLCVYFYGVSPGFYQLRDHNMYDAFKIIDIQSDMLTCLKLNIYSSKIVSLRHKSRYFCAYIFLRVLPGFYQFRVNNLYQYNLIER